MTRDGHTTHPSILHDDITDSDVTAHHCSPLGGVGQASRVSIIAESGQGSPVETRTFCH